MKYELDYTRHHGNGHHEIIAILTGHAIEDIVAASPNADMWFTRYYIETYRKLGFNVNNRFIKFDRNTPYPCMMRFSRIDIKEKYWYAYAYYDDKVYTGNGAWLELNDFITMHDGIYKITSMLQVWI